MAEIIVITGGARSGKSAYAQSLAESLPGPRLYVATCPPGLDPEMGQRIARHQGERRAGGWQTLEETLDLAGALRGAQGVETVLIDCLTLWISNLLQENGDLDEIALAARSEEVLALGRQRPGSLIMVTNEVGSGIVPENFLARRFRDLVGRANQVMAAAADRAILVASGLPVTLKGKE